MKRFLYLFIIVGAVILVVLIGYFLRYRASTPSSSPSPTPGGLPNAGTQSNPPPPGQNTGPSPSESPTPSFAGQKFGVVAQNPTANYYVDAQNNVTLVQPDGQVVEVSNGNANVLSSSVITNLISASFSYDGKKILATFGDPANPQASLFDVASKSWQPLPQGMISASWSSTNYQVAYLAAKGDSFALTTLDLGNAKAKPAALLMIHAQDVIINWIAANQIIFSEKAGALSDGSAWSFDLQKKTFQQLSEGFGLDSAWSGSAGMGLIFEAGQSYHGGIVSIIDTAGNAVNTLKFLTLPEKCTFDTVAQVATSSPETAASSTAKKKTAPAPVVLPPLKYLYCAVPRDTQKMGTSQLPDDYQMGALFTADDFYKTDLSTGDLTSVFADQSQTLDGSDLKVANQTLFFINRLDQKLYAISLQ